LGFLDVGAMPSGGWDPSLAFVMVGALAVTIPAFAFARKRSTPIGTSAFQAPSAAGIEPRLLVGSALFGVGWGLVGYCPGPALAALGLGQPSNLAFVGAMAAGMILHRVTVEKS